MVNKFVSLKEMKVKVCVLINDTVGTLMSTAYYDRKTAVGLILGTGTNAAYFERIHRIDTLDSSDFQSNEVILYFFFAAS